MVGTVKNSYGWFYRLYLNNTCIRESAEFGIVFRYACERFGEEVMLDGIKCYGSVYRAWCKDKSLLEVKYEAKESK